MKSQILQIPSRHPLHNISRTLLTEFLQHFKDDLDPAHRRLLEPDLPSDEFVPLINGLFATPQAMPVQMRQALSAIDDLASTENRPRLEFARLNAPLGLLINTQAPPFQQALHLWLHRPFDPPLGADPVRPSTLNQPPSTTSDQVEAPIPQSPLPTPHSDQPATFNLPPSTSTHPGGAKLPLSPDQAVTLPGRSGEHRSPEDSANGPSTHEPATFNPQPSTSAAAPQRLRLRPGVLFFELAPRLFHEFIRYFQHDLLAKYPALPQPSPDSYQAFADAVGTAIAEPDHLPPRMYDALLAIQELAAPHNAQLLRGLLAQSAIVPNPAAAPEHRALQFWLHCPFAVDDLQPLADQLPAKYLLPPDGQSADSPSIPHSPFGTPHSKVPGDLAAIGRYPRYKISHLPPELRESLNHMLRQRIPYAQILDKLGPHAAKLNKSNLSRWKKTGYPIWLAEQQRREDAHAQLQLLLDLVRENENGKIHEATQQIAALRISQVLAGFDPASLVQTLQQHPQAFVRLVQTLPTLSRGGMDCERLLLELAERKATSQRHNDDSQPRGISQRSLQYMTQKLNLM